MPTYRNRKRQVIYRNGVPQVAYRNGAKVSENLAVTNVVTVGETDTGSNRGFTRFSYGDIAPNGIDREIEYFRDFVSFDQATLKFIAFPSQPFKNTNTKALVTRLDADYREIFLNPSNGIDVSYFLTNQEFFKEDDLDNDVPFSMAWLFQTDWTPVRFASTRIGVASGQGSFDAFSFINHELVALYSNEGTDTSLMQWESSGNVPPPSNQYVITARQKDTNGNVIGQGEFLNSGSTDWICDRAFLQEVDGSIELYMRVLA